MKFDRRLTDEIYTSDTVRLGKDAFQAMQETIYHNGGVGTIAGYYDAELSILSVSDLLLHSLNHSYASLIQFICTDMIQIGVPSVSTASFL